MGLTTIFLASFLIWFLFVGLIILWIIDGKVKKEVVLHAFLAVIISWTLVLMIKSILPLPRPFEINGGKTLTLTKPSLSTSFPSAHATVAFALSTSVWLHNKKIGFWFVLGAILVGIGRIMANVHFLSDIFAGAVFGVIISYILVKAHLFKLLK